MSYKKCVINQKCILTINLIEQSANLNATIRMLEVHLRDVRKSCCAKSNDQISKEAHCSLI